MELNEFAEERLSALEMLKVYPVNQVARKYDVCEDTIYEWRRMHNQSLERLNADRRDRTDYSDSLSYEKIWGEIDECNSPHRLDILHSLLDLANGGRLDETAAKYQITPQALAQRRRSYLGI